jgi:hypothetical protein
MKKLLLIIIGLAVGYMSYGQLNGVYNIPGAEYTTLAAAITALNTSGVSGNVTLNLLAGNPQTAPAGGYSIGSATLSGTGANSSGATRTVTITGNGNTITAYTPQGTGLLNDAIFKIIGADYITIQGFTMQENAANTNTTAVSNNMTEWGVALLYFSATDGAKNATIQDNIISLNRIYQNTFGIYSNVRHTSTSISTTADITNVSGANDNTHIYTNNISNVNNGIVIVGSTTGTLMNTGIDVGGTSSGTGNTVSNYGLTGTFSSYVSVSGSVMGINVNNSLNVNISYNTITCPGLNTAGTVYGVYLQASGTAPTTGGPYNNTVTHNNLSIKSGYSGALNGINNGMGSSVVSFDISYNDLNNFGHTVTSSGAVNCIYSTGAGNNQTISNNTFTNLSVNTTGAVYFIYFNGSLPLSSSTQTVTNNSIVTGFSKTGAGGTVYCTYSNASSVAGSTKTISYNNFSNITLTGGTTFMGFQDTDGGSPSKLIHHNTISNLVGGTSSITCLNFNYGTANIYSNTFSGISGGAGITVIQSGGSSVTLQNIYSNTISGISSSGASAVYGIISQASGASAVSNVYKNKIYDISGTNASSIVYAIYISAGTTINASNNIIGDLRTPAANAAIPLAGIYVSGGTNANVYYNTVYLNASSTGALFGSTALYASTSPILDLRNNILVNTSTPVGATGFTSAYRRSSITLTTYASTSNNNLFYAGATSPTNLIMYDGINSYSTLAAYKTAVGPARDAASISENPNWVSTVGSNPNYLHINTGVGTGIESGGANIATYTDDFDGNVRQGNPGYPVQVNGGGSAPDIGADEFDGTLIPVPKVLNSITYNQASTAAAPQGSTNQEILRLDFAVTGNSGTLNLNSIVVESLNTSDGDVTSVRLYRTTSTTFSTAIPLGTATNFSGGSATFGSLGYDLPSGTTYVWVAYNVAPTATIGNTLDAQILANQIDVAGSYYPAADQSPTGNRKIQNQSIIGTGTSTATWPLYRYYNYSTWECIYLQSELGATKDITKIAFNKSSGADVTDITPVTIYMKHTTATTLTTGKYDLTGYTQVYTGAFPNNATTGWMEVALNNLFSYNGADNLQILIIKGYQYWTSSYPYYYSTTAVTNRARQGSSDTEQPGIPGGAVDMAASTNVPNLRFDYLLPVPKALSGIAVNQASTAVCAVGSTKQEILRLDFTVTGSVGNLYLNSLVVSSRNTNDADISNVKLFRTATPVFSTTNQLGGAQSFLGGTATFSSLNYDLPGGSTTYIWVAYDISISATGYDFADAKILTNSIDVGGSYYPASDQDPAGSRTIRGPLSGDYLVGTVKTTAYTTLTAAVNDLNLLGISGSVNFILTDATYPSETFPIIIGPVSGSSPTKTVTIKPNTGVSATISGSSTTGIMVLYGCDYVILDGSNSGGTDRNLTWENTNTSTYTYVVGLFNNGGTDGAKNCTIKNCNVKATGEVSNSQWGIILNASGGDFDNTVIDNNKIYKCKTAIQFVGVSGGTTNDGQITNNIIGDATYPVTYTGVIVSYADNTLISGNDIFGNASGNTNYSQCGININTGATSTKIRSNKIHDFYYTNTTGYGCFGIYFYSDATTQTEITNNMIYAIKSDGDATSLNFTSQGIYLALGGNCKIYDNSIYMSGNTLGKGSSYNGQSACIGIASGITSVDIRDNALQNSMGAYPGSTMANVSYEIYSASANTAFTDINYNDYYFTDQTGVTEYLGYLVVNCSDLPAWQFATGKDSKSLLSDPKFVSPSDLHINTAAISAVSNAGQALESILTDIDGDLRNDPPDIGADEFLRAGPKTVASIVKGCPGQSVIVPVTVSNFNNIGTISLTLDFNPTVLTYQGLSTSTIPGTWTVDYNVSSGRLIFGAFGPALSLSDGDVLFNLTFLYKGGTCTLDWYDGDGSSCEYSDATTGEPLLDIPLATYYISGAVSQQKTLYLTSLFLEGIYKGSSTMWKAQNGIGPQFLADTADVITVELHELLNYSNPPVYTAPKIKLDTTGNAMVCIPDGITGFYYVTIKHRNSMETTTATPVDFTGSVINYAFDSQAKAYGSNMAVFIDGVAAIYAADENQDGLVDGSDLADIENLVPLAPSGYIVEDINGDGLIDGSDLSMAGNNAAFAISLMIP